MTILLIDNYDSFTYNLAQYFWELGYKLEVHRNDQINLSEVEKIDPSHIVISPGPGTPADSGVSMDLIAHFWQRKPILGVCLGHQCLGQFFDVRVGRAPLPMHGKTSLVRHDTVGIFQDLPNPLRVTRYHSLIVEEETIDPEKLFVTSRSEDDDLVMSLQHRLYPLYGVQFHPESILTEAGHKLLENFIQITS
ncbi:MAG: aminodeoxychorismate/anthranilate synthase component II [Candidatus Caenarcaniphilales bacterium]|nr:aminodeoxychorismate/anthranilate synthase component II [Candidatus Caenarcaniphilales bacterium]